MVCKEVLTTMSTVQLLYVYEFECTWGMNGVDNVEAYHGRRSLFLLTL